MSGSLRIHRRSPGRRASGLLCVIALLVQVVITAAHHPSALVAGQSAMSPDRFIAMFGDQGSLCQSPFTTSAPKPVKSDESDPAGTAMPWCPICAAQQQIAFSLPPAELDVLPPLLVSAAPPRAPPAVIVVPQTTDHARRPRAPPPLA